MADDTALVVVNDLKMELAALVRGLVTALGDHQISVREALSLGLRQGPSLVAAVLALLQDLKADDRAAVLEVLEQGTITMPEEPI